MINTEPDAPGASTIAEAGTKYPRHPSVAGLFGFDKTKLVEIGSEGAVFNSVLTAEGKDRLRGVETKVYPDKGPVYNMRGIALNCAVELFSRITYEMNPNLKSVLPTFGQPNIQVIADLEKYVGELSNDAELADVLGPLRRTYLARSVFGLAHTMIAGKNWNSHGGTLGCAMCNVAGIIESSNLADNEFYFKSAKGEPEGGQKYAWEDSTTYIEYMLCKDGVLDHDYFVDKDHGRRVQAMFDRKIMVDGVPYYAPRPTKGHTVDFIMLLDGIKILDGECKEIEESEIDYLRLFSIRQLMDRDVALSLHTSNTKFVMSSITENTNTRLFKVRRKPFDAYSITARNEIGSSPLKSGLMRVDKVGITALFHHLTSQTLEKWKKLNENQRLLLNSIFGVIDVLVRQIENARAELPAMRQRKKLAYDAGFKEFQYWNAKNDPALNNLLPTRNFPNKNEWIYNRFVPRNVPRTTQAATQTIPQPVNQGGAGAQTATPAATPAAMPDRTHAEGKVNVSTQVEERRITTKTENVVTK